MAERDIEESEFLSQMRNEEEKYVIEQLMKLCSIMGLSYKEDEILEYIQSEIKKIAEERKEELKIEMDVKNYGLYVHVPASPKSSPENVRKTLLFDAHIDQVAEEMMKPRVTTYSDYTKKPNLHLLNATALDNRISCAVLLGLIKFCRCGYIDFICLFSVQEEVGKKGIEYFGDQVDLLEKFPKLRKIFVLDVTNGITPKEKSEIQNSKSKKHSYPIMGDGNIYRLRGKVNPLMEKSLTNLIRFEESKYYGKKDQIRYQLLGVPISGMHEISSFCCVEDVLKLYNSLKYINML